jgi:transcriptional regulator with XRE-family HTH domain
MARREPFVGAGRKSRPSSIDVHVGSRIRRRRILLGVSQQDLGGALGITFQQVQKYERGVSRVGASRLFALSDVLDVPISFFFEDVPDSLTSTHGGQTSRRATEYSELRDSLADDALNRRETLELVRAYYRIIDPAVRKRVFDLINSMGSVET